MDLDGDIYFHDDFEEGGTLAEQHIGNVVLREGEIFVKPDEEAQPVQGNQNLKSVADIVCDAGAVVLTFFILIAAIGIPVTMIVIGSLGIGDCQVEKMIPYYLFIAGIVFLAVMPIAFMTQAWEKCVDQDGVMACCLKCYNGLFYNSVAVFSFVWFICGNVWVYRVDEVDFVNKASPIYCKELTYRFAYWVIIATYVCSVLSCVFTACIRKRKFYKEVK